MTGRRFYLDLAPDEDRTPEPGDLLVFPRVVKEVLEARPTDSKVWAGRWTCRLRTLGPVGQVPTEGRRRFMVAPYRKGEGPQDLWGADADR